MQITILEEGANRKALDFQPPNIRGDACAGPGKESDRCICICIMMTPSGYQLAANSSFSSFEMAVQQTMGEMKTVLLTRLTSDMDKAGAPRR